MGHKEGVKISRNNKDLVDYLMYLTDASWIMASIYYDYLTSPGQFRVVPNNAKNWTLLEFKKPADGFEAIYVSQSPL